MAGQADLHIPETSLGWCLAADQVLQVDSCRGRRVQSSLPSCSPIVCALSKQ